MGKTLSHLMQSEGKPAVAINMLQGARYEGLLLSLGLSSELMGDQPAAPVLASTITLQRTDEDSPSHLDWTSVKSINFMKGLGAFAAEETVRFFDSAAIPPYLWVRVSFVDGEVIEGKIDNSLSLMNGLCLMLYPLDEAGNHECLCVPRSAITNLQIITFRR